MKEGKLTELCVHGGQVVHCQWFQRWEDWSEGDKSVACGLTTGLTHWHPTISKVEEQWMHGVILKVFKGKPPFVQIWWVISMMCGALR